MTNSQYKKHYNIEFNDENFTVITIDENGPDCIENSLLVPKELAKRYSDFRQLCNGKSTESMNFASKSSYYQKLSELFYDMAVWQATKECEDMRMLGDTDSNGLDYMDFRNLAE